MSEHDGERSDMVKWTYMMMMMAPVAAAHQDGNERSTRGGNDSKKPQSPPARDLSTAWELPIEIVCLQITAAYRSPICTVIRA